MAQFFFTDYLQFTFSSVVPGPDGDKPIEMLRAGEKVLTHDGRSTPAIWRARQSVANPRNLSVGRSPVRIEAGALGPDLPDAPLTLTADHALLFDDMLINAGTLVNGTTIRLLPLEEMPARFNYWHVELEEHECVVANGVPAESFIDYVGRSGFDNYDDYLDLVGANRLIAEMPLPRVCAHRLVPPDLREALGIEPPSYRPRRRRNRRLFHPPRNPPTAPHRQSRQRDFPHRPGPVPAPRGFVRE